MPDLTGLSLQAIVGLLVVLGAMDTGGSMLVALAAKTFNAEYATGFLVSHVSKIWFPIIGLALLGEGIAPLAIPAVPIADAAAVASLAAYGIATVGSLKGSLDDRAVPPASS